MTGTLIPPAPATDDRPAHRDPNVLRWLGAYTSSMLGDSIYYIALSWAAVQSGTPAEAGLVMSVSALPRALLMLGGGVLADRLGPRRVVIGSDAVRCAAVLAVAALLFVTSPGLWPLALLAFLFGTVDAVFMPAVGALPARITGKPQLARVQGMRGLAIRFASVVGAPLGGLGVAVGGAAAAFALAGLLIAVSVPLLYSVRVRDLPADDRRAGQETSAWQDLRGGLAYVRRHRVLAPLMITIALGDLGFVGPLNVGLTLLAHQRGWGASGMGSVLAGFGVGAGAASLLLTVRGRLPRAGLVAACAVLAGSVAIGALAYAPGLAAAVGTALLIGLLAGLSGALCGALLQTQADPARLGRVTAVSSLVSLGLAPLSMPFAAAAIGAWGLGPVFVASAVVSGLGGVVALCVPALRRAELPR
ncbi:MFS transporter [Streptomyces collinus]|uniref:Integral membrane efflux protein n=1 Tax=Streptomyces collinus (strain DSM 40733 / Tue 365) TaxID=1214242 RepID=S5UPJ7_STRC3|nr:MFS transporter [Streptomyces collinus]AGS68968.1 integral membrane efflux protein [Streptomyces collinus Tu 365]UJA07607.1 MFS transporter [Streptomyces collinus]UJA17527.1 MFS transporter [Streptomyces collinus]